MTCPIPTSLYTPACTLLGKTNSEIFTDTGLEVNVMSYEFAIKRFALQPDAITHVRFADGSSQQVEGKVSVSVSFGNGAPPSLLLKLVDLNSRSETPAQTPACGADGAINYGKNVVNSCRFPRPERPQSGHNLGRGSSSHCQCIYTSFHRF